jgi:hypothetical protein
MTSESVRFRVGDFSCVSLPDVIETLREEDIENMFNTDAERMLAAFRALPAPLTFCRNILLVDAGDKRLLIDTGMGQSDPNDPGHLLERLQAANITPESIDTVVITHYHQDHIAGLLDHAGNPTFPKHVWSCQPKNMHTGCVKIFSLVWIRLMPPGFAKFLRPMQSD